MFLDLDLIVLLYSINASSDQEWVAEFSIAAYFA